MTRVDMTRGEILDHVRRTIAELFELEVDEVRAESTVFEDLDLDSIDAVDLVIRLQQMTGKKIMPDEFKGVRTVGDVTRCVEKLFTA